MYRQLPPLALVSAVIFVCMLSPLLCPILSAQPPNSSSGSPHTGSERPAAAPEPIASVGGDEIVITAPRLDSEWGTLPYSALVVRGVGDDSIAMPRTLPDALGDLPQVMIQKTGPGQASPFVRGFTGFRTLILVDGIRLNSAVFRDGPNQYTTLVDPLALDSAQVIFGSSSVLYGSDAIGGTVSLHTVSPDYGVGEETLYDGRLRARLATADQSSVVRVEGSAATERVAVVVGAAYRDYDDLSGGRHQGTFENTSYEEVSADVKLRFSVNEEWELTVAHQQHKQLGVPRTHSTIFAQSWRGTTVGSDLRRDLDQGRALSYARLLWDPSSDRRLEITIYRAQLDEEEDRVRSNLRKRLQGFEDVTFGVNVDGELETPVGRLVAGVEHSHEDVDSHFREYDSSGAFLLVRPRGPVADESTYLTTAVYVEDRIEVADDVEVSIGGRYSWVHVDADDVDPDPTDADVISSINDDFSAFVGSARLVWAVQEEWSVFGGVAQAYRAPNLADLTRFDAARSGEAEVPVSGLDPEKFLTVEVGTRVESGRITLQLGYYYTWIDDLITRFPTGATNADGDAIVIKDNVGEGFVHGVEATGELLLNERWSLYGGFAWVEGKSDTFLSPGVTAEEPLSRLQPATGFAGVRLQAAPDVTIEADIRWAADADRLSARDAGDTQRIPVGGTPGYAVAGIRGSWQASDDLRLFLAIENLTDRDYRIHGSGVNEPGTNAVFGIDLRF